MKPVRWRATLVSALVILSVYLVVPTVTYFMQDASKRNDADYLESLLPSWMHKQSIKLGLDLMGGIELTLGIDIPSAVDNRLSRIATELGRSKDKQGDPVVESSYAIRGQQRLAVVLGDHSEENLQAHFEEYYPELALTDSADGKFYYEYREIELKRIRKAAQEQTLLAINKRVDATGAKQPNIFQRNNGTVLVQLPGYNDEKRAKDLLGRTAQLTFHIVDDAFNGFAGLDGADLPATIEQVRANRQLAFRSEDKAALEKLLKSLVPEDRLLLFESEPVGDDESRKIWTSVVVMAEVGFSGEELSDAQMVRGQGLDSKPNVSLRFTPSGSRLFGILTESNVGKQLAIVVDGVVVQAPNISEKIASRGASITLGRGARAVEEGEKLALILKSGAIPAGIEVLEVLQVGASLGPELADKGILGIGIGFFLVLFFMLAYYRRSGVIACVALLLNGLFLLAAMSVFGFALTLPGIAGFVLTLGMAVDANVLINERIRQEIRDGRHPRRAVETAFKRVFWTIVDSNVTTLIAAMVLLETNSSGPIRGFAITLMLGLLVSLFTSLYCTHLFFDLVLRRVPDKKLRGWFGSEKTFAKRNYSTDFLKIGGVATFAAVFLALAVVFTGFTRGLNIGVDFAGGSELRLAFSGDVEADELNAVADKVGLEGFVMQALSGGKKAYLVRYDESVDENHKDKDAESSQVYNRFRAALLSDLADKNPEVVEAHFVGPQVGEELRNQGLLSVLYAILAVILYIAFRFDLRFSPGALVKMFLDIVLMLGFYAFFGATFDLVAVAAFLTVVGYSVNDTIVIYDRIRENLGLYPGRSLSENINMAINESISRSVNTSLTTLASLFGLLMFASDHIWEFAMAMSIGVIVATLTSIFIASSFVVWWQRWRDQRESLQKSQAV